RWMPSPTVVVLVILVLGLAHYLVDPLDRFANELNVFNRILSGDFTTAENTGSKNSNTNIVANNDGQQEKNTANAAPLEGLNALQLVMDRLNTPATVRPSQSLAAIFIKLNPTKTLHAGVDALLSLWNHNLAGNYPASDTAEMLDLYFQQQSLSCEFLYPDTEQLFRINIPGLVRLVAGNNKLWMALLRIDEENVTLQAPGNRRITVTHEEFSIYYGREFLAPWRDPSPNAPILLIGQRGAQVRSLKEQLHNLGRLNASDLNDVYDRRTEEIVIALQSEAGLTADGKAGPQVRLTLNSWAGNTPSLRRGHSRTATRNTKKYDNTTIPVNNKVAADRPSKNTHNNESNGFQAVSKNIAPVDMPQPEIPVMAIPHSTHPSNTIISRENTPFSFPQEPDTKSNIIGEILPDTPGLMKVRELPKPFAQSPSRLKNIYEDSVTSPALGSSPLVPHKEIQP
ncbi:MAG: peptidoglycan-binding protein, partial [Candidatus Hydrogenedentes bacterium]|nr:peptidoglycan-binding protein [Candidatus Hydrogenedentota bacterium]